MNKLTKILLITASIIAVIATAYFTIQSDAVVTTESTIALNETIAVRVAVDSVQCEFNDLQVWELEVEGFDSINNVVWLQRKAFVGSREIAQTKLQQMVDNVSGVIILDSISTELIYIERVH